MENQGFMITDSHLKKPGMNPSATEANDGLADFLNLLNLSFLSKLGILNQDYDYIFLKEFSKIRAF